MRKGRTIAILRIYSGSLFFLRGIPVDNDAADGHLGILLRIEPFEGRRVLPVRNVERVG